MVDIAPFRAIRYDAKKVGRLDDVIAPPYDVISPGAQNELYARHTNNIVRIDLNRSEPGDDAGARYRRAAGLFREWLESGTLSQDDAPALYVLAQSFVGPDGVERTRTGFFSRTRLCRWDEGQILPHERTLRGPKVDRMELMRATHANLSPIFAAYEDPNGEVRSLLDGGELLAEATLDRVHNRMWAIRDPARIECLVQTFSSKKLFIADGHHRYETALAYRDERRAEAVQLSRDPGYEYVLAFAAAVEDPGMVIFPTHRLVHSLSGFDETQIMTALAPYFAQVGEEPTPAGLASAGRRGNAYVLSTAKGARILVSRTDAPWAGVRQLPEQAALRRLDVAVLHSVILEHVLGISRDAQATQTNLRYSKSFEEALAAPRTDPSIQAAFLMNPTRIEEVLEVAKSGEVMPQKSTFFYPKLPSGMVLYGLD